MSENEIWLGNSVEAEMVTVSTRLGPIKGIEQAGSLSFLAIPYAAPPVAALRWRAPESPAAWSGTYDATRHPNRAFQQPFPESLAPPGGIPGGLSEDMLYLNVHTPGADGETRPVMVYIHGGGYTLGSANDFDPSPFAARNDIVVVAINYRLGLLGFLDLSRFGDDYKGSANLGFQDQIAALRWVSENIADYGGDPQNVTVCGCSAGGGSVITLMSAPGAAGLFHKAIAMSPLEVSAAPPDIVTPCAAALKMSDEAFFDHLKSLSAEEVFKFQTDAGVGSAACVDGSVIVQPTVEAIRSGINLVPLLTGCTADEGPMITDGVKSGLGSDPAIFRALEAGMAANAGGGDAIRYTEFLDRFTAGVTAEERLNRVWFDYFRSYVVRSAQALSEVNVPVWVYNFAVPTEHEFGPTHGSDVPFVFNSLDPKDDGTMRVFYRNDSKNRAIADLWSRTFVRFMRTGDPNGPELPPWPSYESKHRSCLVLGDEPSVVENPDGGQALAAYGLA